MLLALKAIVASLCLLSGVITIFLFAFADSPELGRVTGRWFYPIVIGGIVGFGLAVRIAAPPLLSWRMPLALLLVAAPPVTLIYLYRRAG